MFNKKGIIYICSLFTILSFSIVSFQTVFAAEDPLNPPFALPLENVFTVPNGANSHVENKIVTITDNKTSQVGSVFSTSNNLIDLTKDFESEMYIYIDGKADGMTFAMHHDLNALIQFNGSTGGGLGVYSSRLGRNSFSLDGKQLKNSFVVEFDTYFNGDWADAGIANNGYGHVAYAFPDKTETYRRYSTVYAQTDNYTKAVVKHNGLQVATAANALGNGKWKLFSMSWKAFDGTNNGKLTYQLEGFDAVTASIPKSTFGGATSVYWGFTGSTGGSTELAKVTFKSIPGLVNYSDSTSFTNSDGATITDTNPVSQDSEVTYHYTGKYDSGRQDLLKPVFNFTLDSDLTYQQGTFYVDGQAQTPTVNGNVLSFALNKNLSDKIANGNSSIDIQFKVKDSNTTANRTLGITDNVVAENLIQKSAYSSYNIQYIPIAGTGKLTFIQQNDENAIKNADLKTFLSSYSPTNATLTLIEDSENPISEIVKTIGPATIKIKITNDKNQSKTIDVPIFIVNDNISKNNKYIIYGENNEILAKNYPTTSDALKSWMLENAKLRLWEYTDTNVQELSNTSLNLDLSQLPTPSGSIRSGTYTTVVSYGNGTDTLSKNISTEIKKLPITITVKYLDDQDNNPIFSDALTSADLQSNLVFSATPEQSLVSILNEQLKSPYELERAGYKTVPKVEDYALESGNTADRPTEVPDTDLTLVYYYTPITLIYQEVSNVPFGSIDVKELSQNNKTFYPVKAQKSIGILSTKRKNNQLTNWNLNAKLENYDTLVDEDGEKLLGTLNFDKNSSGSTTSITLNSSEQQLLNRDELFKSSSLPLQHISLTNNEVTEGNTSSKGESNTSLKINLTDPEEQSKRPETYTGRIIWSLGDTPVLQNASDVGK